MSEPSNAPVVFEVTTTRKISQSRKLKVSYNRSGGNKIPAIRFAYAWLPQIGINIGEYVELTVMDDGSLVIKKCDSPDGK